MSGLYAVSGLRHLARSNLIFHGLAVRSASTVRSVGDSDRCMIVVLLVWNTLSTCEMIWIVFALGRRIEVHVVRGWAHWPRVSVVRRYRLLASWSTLYGVVRVRSCVQGSPWIPVLDSCFKPNLWNLTVFNKCKLLFDSLKRMYWGASLGVSLN